MNYTKTKIIYSMVFTLTIILVAIAFTPKYVYALDSKKSSQELLLEIMNFHSELVNNETFLAQAKMLGAYLESAQSLEEAQKIKIYTIVLRILSKIKESPASISTRPSNSVSEPESKALVEQQKSGTVFVPGAALLEIFKADSIETIPKLPTIRTYWNRDLAYNGGFLVPERFSEIGVGSRYVARFSFYYDAKETGGYGFTIMHKVKGWLGKPKGNVCNIKIGGVEVVQVTDSEPVGQGVCNLKKGFHRFEFWLVSYIDSGELGFGPYRPENDRPGAFYFEDERLGYARFEVRILTPNSFDAVPLTKDMMLLKKE